jgi:hypothetical protein
LRTPAKHRAALRSWHPPGRHRAACATMLLFRALLFLMLVGAGVCFAFFIATNNLRFRRWGMQLLQYTLLTALVFFGILILSRIL